MVLELRYLKDFLQSRLCMRSKVLPNVNIVYIAGQVYPTGAGSISFFSVSCSLSTDVSHSVRSRLKFDIFYLLRTHMRREYRKRPGKFCPADFNLAWHRFLFCVVQRLEKRRKTLYVCNCFLGFCRTISGKCPATFLKFSYQKKNC